MFFWRCKNAKSVFINKKGRKNSELDEDKRQIQGLPKKLETKRKDTVKFTQSLHQIEITLINFI